MTSRQVNKSNFEINGKRNKRLLFKELLQFRKDNFYKIYKLILKIKIREFHKGNTENSLMKGSITHVKS